MSKYKVKSCFRHLGVDLYERGSFFETDDVKLALSLIKNGLLYDNVVDKEQIQGDVDSSVDLGADSGVEVEDDGIIVEGSDDAVDLGVSVESDVKSDVKSDDGSVSDGEYPVTEDGIEIVDVPVALTGSVDLGGEDDTPDFEKMSKADLISWARSNKVQLDSTVDSKKADIIGEILSKLG